MTEQEKELLLKDLCARLQYGFKYQVQYGDTSVRDVKKFILDGEYSLFDTWMVHEIKPYLRPMSSMMQGEWEEMTAIIYQYGRVNCDPNNKNELLLWLSAEENDMPIILMDNVFSWLNKKMFDYRGLIPMGLALPAPEGMYKID